MILDASIYFFSVREAHQRRIRDLNVVLGELCFHLFKGEVEVPRLCLLRVSSLHFGCHLPWYAFVAALLALSWLPIGLCTNQLRYIQVLCDVVRCHVEPLLEQADTDLPASVHSIRANWKQRPRDSQLPLLSLGQMAAAMDASSILQPHELAAAIGRRHVTKVRWGRNIHRGGSIGDPFSRSTHLISCLNGWEMVYALWHRASGFHAA